MTAEPVEFTVFSAEAGDFRYTIESPPFIYAPVKKGDELAELNIYYNDRQIKSIPLYAAEDADYKMPEPEKKKSFIDKIKEFFV